MPLPDAIIKSDTKTIQLQAPKEGGGYCIFAYVFNQAVAAVANIPFFVNTETNAP